MVDEAKIEEWFGAATNAYGQGIEIMQDVLGWSKIKENNGVAGYQRPNEECNFDSLKVEWYADKPASSISRYIFENVHTLNESLNPENIASFKIIKEINDNVRVYSVQLHPMGPVSSRFLTTVAVYLDLGDGKFAIAATSVDAAELAPMPEDCVEGKLRLAVDIYEPVGDDTSRTHFCGVDLIDPQGSVPAMLVNSFLAERTTMWEKIKEKFAELP